MMPDKDIVFFYPDKHEKHSEPGHPERPERVNSIYQVLDEQHLFAEYSLLDPKTIPVEILYTIHEPKYLNKLEIASQRSQSINPDTYLTPYSWQLALNAAGGAAAVAESVWLGETRRGMALCRPPGHHATRDQAMGFCLINNIAVAAETLIQTHGAARIAIVDIDVHHGNGTQDIFWKRGDVLYFSIHQLPLYPMSGYLEETGADEGEGKTMNIPLPPYSGDRARLAAFDQVLLPMLERYNPEMVLVSYGYDAHWRDPLAHQLVSADNYARLIQKLVNWCDANCKGRLAVFLEGGYDLEAGKACTLAVTQALLGKPWVDPIGPYPQPEGDGWQDTIERAVKMWM